jgi:hypothetical protein
MKKVYKILAAEILCELPVERSRSARITLRWIVEK